MRTRSILFTIMTSLFIGFALVSCNDDDKIELPTQVVSGLAFVDTDLTEGQIKGLLSWDALYETGDIRTFVVYLSADGKSRDQKLGEVNVDATNFEVPEGTAYKEYMLVVAANGLGEATSAASLKIVDAINVPIPPTPVSGYYFLNSGKHGSNNSSLYFYNQIGTITADVFATQNGRKLGDTAQDILVYGNKMYIAVYGSGTIEVTDLEGKSLKQISSVSAVNALQPRYLTAAGGNVYVSLFDGYVARIDTTNLVLDTQIEVGRNPEQLAVANNKLYVANSGGMDYNTEIGYDKTVSVIDLETFTEIKKLEVGVNPGRIETDTQGNVYVISMGNYKDIPNRLQRIDPATDEISVIGNATEMTIMNDIIYLYYSQYDANWNQTITFSVYDTQKEEMTDGFFSDGTTVGKPYNISSDQASNSLFILESDYSTNGDAYIYNKSGKLQKKIEVGLNPIKGVAVNYFK